MDAQCAPPEAATVCSKKRRELCEVTLSLRDKSGADGFVESIKQTSRRHTHYAKTIYIHDDSARVKFGVRSELY